MAIPADQVADLKVLIDEYIFFSECGSLVALPSQNINILAITQSSLRNLDLSLFSAPYGWRVNQPISNNVQKIK